MMDEYIKIAEELSALSDDDGAWDEKTLHYSIYYNHIVKCIGVQATSHLQEQHRKFYFKSWESAEQAIETIGRDRLKKWFGMEV